MAATPSAAFPTPEALAASTAPAAHSSRAQQRKRTHPAPLAATASTSADLLRPAKLRSHQLMHVKKGQRLLDVGCGPGGDAMALARLVGRKGFVVGVDSERGFIETAQRCALSAGLASRMHFRIVDLLPLPFRSDEFDATRSERTFQHLTDPGPALAEMVRVTRPGGRIVLVDIDWVSASVDSPFPDVERLLKRILIDDVIPNPYAGRSLFRLMRTQGLEEIEVESSPVTISALHDLRHLANFDRCEAMALERALISEERLAQWRAALEQAEAERTLFAQVNLLLVAGVVPAA